MRARSAAPWPAAVLLAASAALIPARGAAVWLAGADAERLGSVVVGMWAFKALLVVHAIALLLLPRLRDGRPARTALLAPVAEEARDERIAHEGWILAGIVAFALALRLWGLGAGLWYDEITAFVKYARAPFGAIVTTFDSQNQHLLFSLLAHASLGIFGDGAAALRLPAALFGVGSIWATWWLGTLIGGRRESLLAAALLAVSYHHLWFSQNARGYSGLLFFTLVSTALVLLLLRARDVRIPLVVAYAVVAALGVWTMVAMVFVVAAHFVVWAGLVWRARERSRAAWAPLAAFVLAGTLTLQLYAPVLPQLLVTTTTPTMAGVETEWRNPLWFAAEALRGLRAGVPGGLFTLACGAAVGLAGLASFFRRSPAVVALMLLPAVLTAAAMLATAHNLWPRLFFFCAGFAVLIAVRGVFAAAESVLASRHAPRLATGALVLVALASIATLPRAWRPKQDFVSARDYVERQRAPGDAVVAVDLTRFPYGRWLATDWSAAATAQELEAIESRHQRTWVVYTFPERLRATQPALWQRLQQAYTPAARFPGTIGGGAVVVMLRG